MHTRGADISVTSIQKTVINALNQDILKRELILQSVGKKKL